MAVRCMGDPRKPGRFGLAVQPAAIDVARANKGSPEAWMPSREPEAGPPPPLRDYSRRSPLAMAVGNSLRFAYALILPAMRDDLAWSYTQAGALNTINAVI